MLSTWLDLEDSLCEGGPEQPDQTDGEGGKNLPHATSQSSQVYDRRGCAQTDELLLMKTFFFGLRFAVFMFFLNWQ